MLEAFILRWGYLAVGIGTFVEGEAVLLAAGALSHRGLMTLPLAILAAFTGSVLGDLGWFLVGRRYGPRVEKRSDAWRARAARAQRFLSDRGWLFVLGFRFIYGIRIVTPVSLGAARYPFQRFAVLNAIGGALWATAFAALGWLLGASLHSLLARTARIEELLAASLAVGVLAVLVRRWTLRRRARIQTAHT